MHSSRVIHFILFFEMPFSLCQSSFLQKGFTLPCLLKLVSKPKAILSKAVINSEALFPVSLHASVHPEIWDYQGPIILARMTGDYS